MFLNSLCRLNWKLLVKGSSTALTSTLSCCSVLQSWRLSSLGRRKWVYSSFYCSCSYLQHVARVLNDRAKRGLFTTQIPRMAIRKGFDSVPSQTGTWSSGWHMGCVILGGWKRVFASHRHCNLVYGYYSESLIEAGTYLSYQFIAKVVLEENSTCIFGIQGNKTNKLVWPEWSLSAGPHSPLAQSPLGA